MVLYPEMTKKAQAEIDKVIGHSRLPDYSDRPSLPNVEAFYREVMRWRPVLPLSEYLSYYLVPNLRLDAGVIHSTSDSDIYEEYFIPKGGIYYLDFKYQYLHFATQGALVIGNIW